MSHHTQPQPRGVSQPVSGCDLFYDQFGRSISHELFAACMPGGDLSDSAESAVLDYVARKRYEGYPPESIEGVIGNMACDFCRRGQLWSPGDKITRCPFPPHLQRVAEATEIERAAAELDAETVNAPHWLTTARMNRMRSSGDISALLSAIRRVTGASVDMESSAANLLSHISLDVAQAFSAEYGQPFIEFWCGNVRSKFLGMTSVTEMIPEDARRFIGLRGGVDDKTLCKMFEVSLQGLPDTTIVRDLSAFTAYSGQPPTEKELRALYGKFVDLLWPREADAAGNMVPQLIDLRSQADKLTNIVREYYADDASHKTVAQAIEVKLGDKERLYVLAHYIGGQLHVDILGSHGDSANDQDNFFKNVLR